MIIVPKHCEFLNKEAGSVLKQMKRGANDFVRRAANHVETVQLILDYDDPVELCLAIFKSYLDRFERNPDCYKVCLDEVIVGQQPILRLYFHDTAQWVAFKETWEGKQSSLLSGVNAQKSHEITTFSYQAVGNGGTEQFCDSFVHLLKVFFDHSPNAAHFEVDTETGKLTLKIHLGVSAETYLKEADTKNPVIPLQSKEEWDRHNTVRTRIREAKAAKLRAERGPTAAPLSREEMLRRTHRLEAERAHQGIQISKLSRPKE